MTIEERMEALKKQARVLAWRRDMESETVEPRVFEYRNHVYVWHEPDCVYYNETKGDESYLSECPEDRQELPHMPKPVDYQVIQVNRYGYMVYILRDKGQNIEIGTYGGDYEPLEKLVEILATEAGIGVYDKR